MKYNYSLGFLFLLLSLSACAQQEDLTNEISEKVNKLYAAMIAKDEATLTDLTADKLSYGHSSGTLEDKAAFVDAVLHGPFEYVTITPENQHIIISGDTALVRHTFVTNGINAGAPTTVRIGNLMTFQKLKGKWKLLGRQAYKL